MSGKQETKKGLFTGTMYKAKLKKRCVSYYSTGSIFSSLISEPLKFFLSLCNRQGLSHIVSPIDAM